MFLKKFPWYHINHIELCFGNGWRSHSKILDLIKAGFPARYVARLSAITDVRMKDGNLHETHGVFSLGIIAAKLMLEGPLKKEKISYLVTARRSIFDIFMRPASLLATNGEIQSGYTFFDVNFKLQYLVNEKNRLYISFYTGRDRLFMNFFDKDSEKSIEVIIKFIGEIY